MAEISLKKLTEIINSSIPNDLYIVKAEVNQPKLSNGNLYFTLREDDTTLKSIIWKSCLNQEICEGDKIALKGKLEFYNKTGTVSFVGNKIIEKKGLGDLYLQFTQLKTKFLDLGYFDKEKKIGIPNKIKNILVLTAENGAALQDFLFHLKNSKSNVNVTLGNILVQGDTCADSIIKELSKQELIYDLIVITRGGGSWLDLNGFNDESLIKYLYKFKENQIPILTAIGHQVDITLCDFISDISCPTPSLAADYIVKHNSNYYEKTKLQRDEIKDKIKNLISQEINEIIKNEYLLNTQFLKIKDRIKELKNKMKSEITQTIFDYELQIQKLSSLSNIDIIENNNKITDYESILEILSEKKPFMLKINDIVVKITKYETT